jgi:hypothetical protein
MSTQTAIDRMRRFTVYAGGIPGYTPSLFKQIFFKECARVLAPVIMRDCDDEEQARTMTEFSLEPLDTPFLFGEAGRRTGKTDAMAHVIAALLLSVPDITVSFFAPRDELVECAFKRAIDWLARLNTDELVTKTENYKFEVSATNKAKLTSIIVTSDEEPDDVRTVYFYGESDPPAVDVSDGSDVVICDEAHLAPEATVQTMLELATKGARVLLVSTPSANLSPAQKIVEGHIDGKPMCRMVRAYEACITQE